MANEKTNVAVIGMGKGGAALLEMLEGDEVVKVVGVAETNPDAPGLVIAKRMGIPIHTDWKPLLKYEGLNDIIDVTGNPKIYEALLKEKPANVDIMGGPAAKMMWLLIEERKEAEEKLEEQSRFSDNLFESVANGLVLLNLKKKIIKINRAALKMLGLKREEVLGKICHKIFCPAEEGKRPILDLGESLNMSDRIAIHKDGRRIPILKTVARIEFGGEGYLLESFVDITNRKEAEEELKAVNQELESFTYTASHDLKEPLRSLETFSQFLVEDYADKLDDEGKDYLKRIGAGSARMRNLIDDLLALSRISRIKNPYESVDSETLVKDALKRLKASLEEKSTKVTVDDELPHIHCDTTKMKEVFYNLITNAMKYNDKPDPSIEIGTKDKTTFFVKDNGKGIDKQYQDLIFQPFKRGPNAKESSGGSGVGLALVKKIIEEHKGRIWVESEPGRGSTFYFTLPQHKEG